MKLKALLLILGLLLSGLYFSSCSHNSKNSKPIEQTPSNKSKEIYTCPMHPQIISDKQGKCPKCGMDLVKKEERMVFMCPGDCEYLCNKPGKCPYCKKELIKKAYGSMMSPSNYEVMKP